MRTARELTAARVARNEGPVAGVPYGSIRDRVVAAPRRPVDRLIARAARGTFSGPQFP